MSLKSICADFPKFEPTGDVKIKQKLLTIIRQLYSQGYDVGDFRDLINCIDKNNIDTNSLDLPYDYPTLKKDILSGKYDNEHVYSDIDIEKLKQKIENGEIQGTIRS